MHLAPRALLAAAFLALGLARADAGALVTETGLPNAARDSDGDRNWRGIGSEVAALGHVFAYRHFGSGPLVDPKRFARDFSAALRRSDEFPPAPADVRTATHAAVPAAASGEAGASEFLSGAELGFAFAARGSLSSKADADTGGYEAAEPANFSFGAPTVLGAFSQPKLALALRVTARGSFEEVSPENLILLHDTTLPNPVGIPEPAPFILLAGGGFVLFLARRRRQRS